MGLCGLRDIDAAINEVEDCGKATRRVFGSKVHGKGLVFSEGYKSFLLVRTNILANSFLFFR